MADSTIQSGVPSDYYAPSYRVEVDGRELDPKTKGDVLQVKVVMEMDNLTSFDLTFNNWDDRALDFKYSDTDTFDLGRRIHVQMGYADRMVSMVTGLITSLQPTFPGSGSPTISVSGLDSMFCLKDRKPKEGEPLKYNDVADWQIAQAIASRNGLTADVTKEGPVHEQVIQKNQDDAQFLMERAKRIDFDVFVRTDPLTQKATLCFIKPPDGRDSQRIRVYAFKWGESLMSFTPKLTLSGQVSKLTVRGWDPRTKKEIKATADSSDLPGGNTGGTTGPAAVEKCFSGSGGKEERTVDAPVTSEQEAKRLAVSLLLERAYEFVTGSGQIIGLPDLRPGDNMELNGLGDRFSGRYYVKKVEHALGDSGYTTQFEVRKFHIETDVAKKN